MSSGLINRRTLVPPIRFGGKVTDEEWDRIFPYAPKRITETKEEYIARASKVEEPEG